LADALKSIPQSNHPDLLVGFNKADDAGVFRINDKLALVQTLDFFPPIVDDPYYFGQIAAANALSDIYAMGGQPKTALNIVAFPEKLGTAILSDILKGGTEKVEEAGAVIVGGHSIKDNELKYGLSVTGLIDPNRIITNSGAQYGDRIYLTKKLGTGIITTGIKRDVVKDDIIETVIRQMVTLNREAAELMLNHKVTSATDITGYGLMGHAFEMADGSNVTIKIYSQNLPILPNALELADQGMITAGAGSNRAFLEGRYTLHGKINSNIEHILFDPQTSGGLLMAIPEKESEFFETDAKEKGIDIAFIGVIESKSEFPLIVE